ncbi:MAG: hypothetical protein IGR80_06525 [Synechococcales cyanobacterium K44_A2020_017]|nr:hypothetical protein [Synechococcales cyanobacterium K32_A2020_035]MBF2094398.1 hypothetical protein [Synechococcales cyanobacterium K44_A2020_017]
MSGLYLGYVCLGFLVDPDERSPLRKTRERWLSPCWHLLVTELSWMPPRHSNSG